MKLLKTSLIALMLISANVTADEASKTAANISIDDLAPLTGPEWTGSLSYLDYGSNKTATIPVSIRFDSAKSASIRYHIKFPGESQYNESAKLKITRDGTRLNGEPVVKRSLLPDGTVVVVTRDKAKDDGRPADIRTTYSLSTAALTIRKDVRFAGDNDYFERNAYTLTRQIN